VLLFLAIPGRELFFQLVGISFMTLSSISAAAKRGIANIEISIFELSLVCAGLLSLFVSFIHGNEFSILYSILFIFVTGAISILVRSVSLFEIISATGYAYIAMLITISATNFSSLATSLTMNAGHRWELRFSPFYLHPDLFGFIFGGGCAILLINAAFSCGLKRIIFLATSIYCIPLILAASARASVLALLVPCMGLAALNVRRFDRKYLFIMILVVFLGLLKWQMVYQYLNDVLELSSETRGFQSGASGRDVAWQVGFFRIFVDGTQFLFGIGLRAATEEWLGITTESSYINILLESGFIIGLFMIFAIMHVVYMSFRLVSQSSSGGDLFTTMAILILILFVVLQSIFNRYLVAIGNPLSLAFLIICAKISVLSGSEVFRGLPAENDPP
jgi:hypothetical protein